MEIKIDFKKEILLLVLILLIAAFLRLYRIKDYLIFLGDQGRDVLVVAKMIKEHKLILLGPTASVGGFYLGPFYYYLMILPLWLACFDPVGPAIMVALFGIMTVFMLYFFLKVVFNQQLALLSSFFYAISPLTVRNSRFSWNPNVLPFFSLAFFFCLYLSKLKKQRWLILISGILLGICCQLHYLALILAPIGIFLNFERKIKEWFLNCLYLFLGCLISLSPFIIFEFRHNFTNFRAIFEFITRKNGAVAFYPLSLLPAFFEISARIFADFLGLQKNFLLNISLYILLTSLLFLLFRTKNKKKKIGILIIITWWLLGAIFLRFYQGTIYEYYYGYLYPLPAIALGFIFGFFFQKKFFLIKALSAGFVVFLVYNCLSKQPILKVPNKMLAQTQRIAKSIISKSRGRPYNFALISKGNSDHAYRYFLEIERSGPTPLEKRVEEQLFVVCESEICQPLGHPLWEIAAFGRAEVAEVWEDQVGIRIFRLVHHADSLDWVGKPAPKG